MNIESITIKGKLLVKNLLSSSLVKSSSIYTISGVLNASIPFFLLPVLTRYLTPTEFGIISMFQILVSFLYPFVSLNLEGSIARKYYDEEKDNFKKYIGTCFFLFTISLLASTLFYIFFRGYISSLVKLPEFILKYSLIVAGCQFITSVILVLYQVRVKPVNYGFFQITQSLLNLFLTICLVVYLNKSWIGRIDAQIISGIVFAISAIFLLIYKREIIIDIEKKDVVDALKFGLPLIPHAIGAMLFTAIDRSILAQKFGLEQTGNYTVAYQLGAVISLFTVAFNNAYVPWLFNNLNKKCDIVNKKIVKFTYSYFIVIILFSLLILLLFPFLTKLFIGGSYKSIGSFSTFIVLGFVLQGMYFMVTNYIIYAKKTYIQAILTISIAILKIPITYYLVALLGPSGVSVSFFVTYFLFFASTWLASSKIYSMPWNIFKY